MNIDIQKYNDSLVGDWREICEMLSEVISENLNSTESKIWHAHPVWFIDGNPICGYDKLKDCVRLLFWSGQTFSEPALHPEGSFKAAEIRFVHPNDVNKSDLKKWLKKAEEIQWDYKNIVKRRGTLVRLK